MIKLERFAISKRPYAVDLGSLRVVEPNRAAGGEAFAVQLNAVWFRRRRGVTVACAGRLWDYMTGAPPTTAVEALQRMDDGRYGGDCQGRWDGSGYWGVQDLDVITAHVALLRPMLSNYPAIPPGYDGWWTYP